MKASEKKLITIAIMVLAMVVVIRIVPMLKSRYQQDQAEVARLESQLMRFTRLVEEEDELAEKVALMALELEDLQNKIFAGTTESLISSGVQRQLRNAVAGVNVNVNEMNVARVDNVGDWVIVKQDMTFTIQQADIINFLDLIEDSEPYLHIEKFSVSRTRRQFNGDLTVVGFGRSLEQNKQGQE